MAMKIGDRIYFGRKHGEKTLGVVVKVNRTTVKVKTLESRGRLRYYAVGTVWKVPFALCSPAPSAAAVAEAERIVGLPQPGMGMRWVFSPFH